MSTAAVSSKFQIVIPKEIREEAGLKAGTGMEIINCGSRIELIPLRPIGNLKGIFKGIDTKVSRDDSGESR